MDPDRQFFGNVFLIADPSFIWLRQGQSLSALSFPILGLALLKVIYI